MSKQAWVTLATNDSYGLGALVLAHSLRRVGSAHPAVVLITPSVTDPMRERLRAVFAEVVIVDILDSRDAAHLALLQRPELGITFTKIHCWNLTQYDKAVFLDADTLVVQNCDELFDREELSAAPDVGWPDCFNSGVFVFRPSADTFSKLITFASERGSFDGGDQGLLNSYFSDWAHGDITKHLPFLYNVTSAAFYSYIPALKHFGQNLKIIHFIGAVKPWLQQYNWESRSVQAPEHLRDFLQLWWDLFVAEVHTQLDVNMDNIEDDTSAVEEEFANFREPVLHSIYYEPTLNPESEFPWHHPDNQIQDSNITVPEIDMSQHHDPWNIYRGNIPPSTEQSAPTEQTVDDYQDMRKYAWDYMPPQHEQPHYERNNQEHSFSSHQHVHNPSEGYHSEHKHENFSFHHEYNHTHQHSEYHQNQNYNNSQQHFELHSNDSTHYISETNNEQQTAVTHDHQEPHYSHEHHYGYFNQSQNTQNDKVSEHNYESQINSHISHTSQNLYDQEEIKTHNKREKYASYSQFQNQSKVEQVYTVMMDHVKMRCHHDSERVNGYGSDSDSDLYEDIRPRHPYDGFYLRHRMTIDPRGKKICIHEIPYIPRSPTPDSSEDFEDAIEEFPEEINDKIVNDDDSHTGVAGNLARVVPGAPLQREAVDELARRQGWEAGNIDYMGADSFDNILAKISQTLSQPPAQTEQPSESQSESAPQPQSDPPAEASKEQVETVTEKETVLETSEKEVVVESPVEVPKPVEAEPEKAPAPEAAAPEVVASKPTEPAPAEVPAPASEASEPSGKIEEPIPIPAEIAAVETPTAEVAAAEESTSPVEVKEKTDEPEIPVAALEALKIDEPAAEAPIVEAAPAAEAVPVAESKPEEAAKPEGSDSPPLANTPSKEEIPAPVAKLEERRKPAGKLQLRPPAAGDALPTPDSELEDAAALAHAIIASELRTPTVTAPSPPHPASPPAPPAPAAPAALSVQPPEVPTPPVGAVSLSQIGVKSKPSTAAQIESSVTARTEDPKPEADAPKKKLVKKAVKKQDSQGASGAEAPVPPPRKKEKKPKDK